MKHIYAIFAAALLLLAPSCSGDKSAEKAAASPDSVPDRSAEYNAGRNRAHDMIVECADSSEVSVFLLRTHVDINRLRLEKGDLAADEYREGFENYVREADPALADKIF